MLRPPEASNGEELWVPLAVVVVVVVVKGGGLPAEIYPVSRHVFCDDRAPHSCAGVSRIPGFARQVRTVTQQRCELEFAEFRMSWKDAKI